MANSQKLPSNFNHPGPPPAKCSALDIALDLDGPQTPRRASPQTQTWIRSDITFLYTLHFWSKVRVIFLVMMENNNIVFNTKLIL